jgi:predicted TIM-barrel fold metal-dependent hydrolase
LFATAHELGLAIVIHPAFPLAGDTVSEYQLTSILGFLFDTTTATLRLVLAGIFDRYPGLKLVISHVGGLIPFIVGRIDYLSTNRPGGSGRLSVAPSEHLRHLYVDGVCLWPPALRLGIEFFGADHVMFGTDHPYWPMELGVATVSEAGLAAGDERQLAGATAAAVMGLDQ